jgi:hypothetical protein
MVERGSRGGASLSVGALWREPGGGSLCWGSWKYVGRLWRRAYLFIGAPFWGTWGRAHLPGTLRCEWRGLGGWGFSLSEEAPWGAWGGASTLGTLEGTLRKTLDAGIPPCGGPFVVGKPDMLGGGGSYIEDVDRWMKEGSSGGASLCEGFL